MSLDSACWIANLTELKLQLGITDATQDSLLESIANRAYRVCEQYMNRKIKEATYTEYYDGDGTAELLLAQYPLVSVTSLFDDVDRDYGADTQIAATDFMLYKERGILRLDGGDQAAFANGHQNVKIVYVAGYSAVPGELIDALLQMIETMFNRAQTGGFTTASLGGKTETYDLSEIPPQVKRVLRHHKNHGTTRYSS